MHIQETELSFMLHVPWSKEDNMSILLNLVCISESSSDVLNSILLISSKVTFTHKDRFILCSQVFMFGTLTHDVSSGFIYSILTHIGRWELISF